MPNLVELIQKIASDVIDAAQPVDVVFGTVLSVVPLKINIEQKLTLDAAHLVLTNSVKDCEVEMTPDGGTRTKYTVHNSLKIGDTVNLIRKKGGQKYVVFR